MRSTLIWLIVAGAAVLFGDPVSAWNRQIFNRYSRNLFRNAGGVAFGVGGNENEVSANGNELDDFNALFGLSNDAINKGGGGGGVDRGGPANGGALGIGLVAQQQLQQQQQQQQQPQGEVYGIVEPLIEDMPCVDRPCNDNDDCCPTGVCVNTYGEGKCIYVYGRKRDLCHRNTDCEPGMACLRAAAGNMVCQPTTASLQLMGLSGGVGGVVSGTGGSMALEQRQYGGDCVSSSDCNVAKGVCCQLQRNHHRMLPRKMCTYFRDPFMCIDILPAEDEEISKSRFLTSFSQRRM